MIQYTPLDVDIISMNSRNEGCQREDWTSFFNSRLHGYVHTLWGRKQKKYNPPAPLHTFGNDILLKL